MTPGGNPGHSCYRCELLGEAECEGLDESILDTIEATYSASGGEVFFMAGYSAREIARRRALECDGRVFVNNVSTNVRRPGEDTPAEFAVSRDEVHTLRPADECHPTAYRAFWRPL